MTEERRCPNCQIPLATEELQHIARQYCILCGHDPDRHTAPTPDELSRPQTDDVVHPKFQRPLIARFRTIREAADLTGIPYHTIYHAVVRGELPASREGHAYAISAEAFEAWRRRHASKGKPRRIFL